MNSGPQDGRRRLPYIALWGTALALALVLPVLVFLAVHANESTSLQQSFKQYAPALIDPKFRQTNAAIGVISLTVGFFCGIALAREILSREAKLFTAWLYIFALSVACYGFTVYGLLYGEILLPIPHTVFWVVRAKHPVEFWISELVWIGCSTFLFVLVAYSWKRMRAQIRHSSRAFYRYDSDASGKGQGCLIL
jgi:hypothetical protein